MTASDLGVLVVLAVVVVLASTVIIILDRRDERVFQDWKRTRGRHLFPDETKSDESIPGPVETGGPRDFGL